MTSTRRSSISLTVTETLATFSDAGWRRGLSTSGGKRPLGISAGIGATPVAPAAASCMPPPPLIPFSSLPRAGVSKLALSLSLTAVWLSLWLNRTWSMLEVAAFTPGLLAKANGVVCIGSAAPAAPKAESSLLLSERPDRISSPTW